jgi:hypothetical protein
MEAARLWARGELTNEHTDDQSAAEVDEAMAAFGLVREGDVVPKRAPFYLWPDNLEAWALFIACNGEWRGGQHREGLDKPGVEIVMRDICDIPPRRRRQRMRDIHLMEGAALKAWGELRAEQSRD